MINWTHIVIHHSLTKDSRTVSWDDIRRYHTDPNGPPQYRMKEIGYHFGIELVDESYEILVGRMQDENGAHCPHAGMNRHGLGIMVTGNFDAEIPTVGAWNKALALCRSLMAVWKIPKENVIGHREAGAMTGLDWEKGQFKSCPGRLFSMQRFRENL